MSVRSPFRSANGCCICGTKSSSSRFTDSQRFCQYFAGCFGAKAADRHGDLCNACVLYVKRWNKKTPDMRKAKNFSEVVDSKRGLGPKHMKQITKRQRRRESRTASSGSSGSTACSSHSGGFSYGVNSNMANSCTFNSPSNTSFDNSTTSCASSGSLSVSSYNSSLLSEAVNEFRAPQPPGDMQSGSTRRNTYKRRVTMPPVKMPSNVEEVDLLLRDIMQSNSEALNFDPREMHRAVQNVLRLRSRTIHHDAPDQHSVSSGSFGSSVGNLDALRN